MGVRESAAQMLKRAFENKYRKPFDEKTAEKIEEIIEANAANDKAKVFDILKHNPDNALIIEYILQNHLLSTDEITDWVCASNGWIPPECVAKIIAYDEFSKTQCEKMLTYTTIESVCNCVSKASANAPSCNKHFIHLIGEMLAEASIQEVYLPKALSVIRYIDDKELVDKIMDNAKLDNLLHQRAKTLCASSNPTTVEIMDKKLELARTLQAAYANNREIRDNLETKYLHMVHFFEDIDFADNKPLNAVVSKRISALANATILKAISASRMNPNIIHIPYYSQAKIIFEKMFIEQDCPKEELRAFIEKLNQIKTQATNAYANDAKELLINIGKHTKNIEIMEMLYQMKCVSEEQIALNRQAPPSHITHHCGEKLLRTICDGEPLCDASITIIVRGLQYKNYDDDIFKKALSTKEGAKLAAALIKNPQTSREIIEDIEKMPNLNEKVKNMLWLKDQCQQADIAPQQTQKILENFQNFYDYGRTSHSIMKEIIIFVPKEIVSLLHQPVPEEMPAVSDFFNSIAQEIARKEKETYTVYEQQCKMTGNAISNGELYTYVNFKNTVEEMTKVYYETGTDIMLDSNEDRDF